VQITEVKICPTNGGRVKTRVSITMQHTVTHY